MSVGRQLPQSSEAEEYLLGCCLLDGPEVLSRCIEANITGESFYDTKHQIVFERLLAMFNSKKETGIDVLAEELKTAREFDKIGGYPFLTQISSRIPTTAQASYFIDKVREQAILRQMIRSATGIVEDCYGFTGGIDEFVDQAEAKFFSVTQNRATNAAFHIRDLARTAVQTISAMADRKGELTGVASGFPDLDRLTWGFQKSDLIIIAARPSMGKTSLALNIAETAALPRRGSGIAVLVFSLEMSASQLALRLLCTRARVNMFMFRDGLKNSSDQERLVAAADELTRAALLIDDSTAISVMQLRAKARRIHSRTPVGMIVVDYLQLLAPTDSSVPREQQVSEISRGLKVLAKELNIPVIVLSQLNRMSETEKRAPRLADLRSSGAIEQDADVVLMLSRPLGSDDKFKVAGDVADLVVAKQRNGPVGEIKLTFLREITRFESYRA